MKFEKLGALLLMLVLCIPSISATTLQLHHPKNTTNQQIPGIQANLGTCANRNDNPYDSFASNPIQFISRNILTTYLTTQIWSDTSDYVVPSNNVKYNFHILKTSDNAAYALLTTNPSPIQRGLEALWLTTKGRVTVPTVTSTPSFVMSAELQGCTLYIKYLPNSRMEIFHHYRYFDKPGFEMNGRYVTMDPVTKKYPFQDTIDGQIVTDSFDDALTFEQYNTGTAVQPEYEAVTPLLWSDGRKWYFLVQRHVYRVGTINPSCEVLPYFLRMTSGLTREVNSP